MKKDKKIKGPDVRPHTELQPSTPLPENDSGENMSEATPRPWIARLWNDPQWSVGTTRNTFELICLTSQGNDKANAELIATAVNSHEALLEAVRAVVSAHRASNEELNRLGLKLNKMPLYVSTCREAIELAER